MDSYIEESSVVTEEKNMRGEGMRKIVLNAVVGLAVLALLVFLPVKFAQAQSVTGTIRGTVTDPSGAAVPQANVTATNAETGYVRSVQTDVNGSFELLSLPLGTYSVKIEKQGFKSFTQTSIPLKVNQIYAVDAKLEVGAASTTVEVSGNALQVETTSIQRGTVIENNEFKDMPLLNRNWTQLMASVPGVMASSDRFGLNSSSGNRTQSNDYLVNGGDVNDFALNTPLDLPNPDSIQEVRLLTNTVNPEYSRSSGATLNAISKGGTNAFHGDAWEFYRDTFMNARNFFSPSKVPPFHQNQFGGDLGGPIFKNKLFAFFSYEGTRSFSGAARDTHVYTNTERTGDWSKDIAATGIGFSSTNLNPFPLFGNAESPCPVSGGTPCAANSVSFATLFDSNPAAADANVIPSQDFTLNPDSALANSFITNFVPTATINGGAATRGDFLFSNNTTRKTNQYIGRLDFNINSQDSLYFYVFTQPQQSADTLPFIGANLPGFGEKSVNNQYQYLVNETHIFNSNMLNEFRVQYQRFNFVAVQPQQVVLPSSAGFNINSQIASGAGLPTMSVSGFFTLGFSEDGPQPRIDDNGQLSDNFSYIRNNHSYKMGIDFRRNHSASPFGFLNNGFFSFRSAGTVTSGVSGADFMLGIPLFFEQTSGGFEDSRNWEYYSYIQDQWRIVPSLTMTYGAGWDIQTPLANHTNGCRSITAFRPGQQSVIYPTAPTGLLFPGDPGINCAGTRTRYDNFAPRLGFAWAPTQKWSVRAAWGIYYNAIEGENTLQFLVNLPFSLTSIGVTNGSFAPGFVNPFANIDGSGTPVTNPFPFTPPAAGQPFNFNEFGPITETVIDPNYRLPYNMNDNLTFEYALSPTMVASIAYVGSEGRRLENTIELNPFNPAACLALGTATCASLASTPNLDFVPGIGTTIDASQVAGIGQLSTSTSSNYNSLQATFNKAFSHGLFFQGAYTWGHALDNSSSLEDSEGLIPPGNPRLVYGDSTYDARHRFVAVFDYAIPSLHSRFGWAPDRIFSGWKVAGVATYQTGFPITLSESDGLSLQCNPATTSFGCWDRPNVAGPLVFENPRVKDPITSAHQWFSPASFTTETLGVLGNAGRNYFHGPGINDWDMSIIKDTRIMEKKQIELRMDIFNAFNHAQFNNPDGNITDGVGAFGAITSTRIPGRILQLAAKFDF